MKTPNRDLLVLVKDEFPNKLSMEYELEQLNEILFRTRRSKTSALPAKYSILTGI